MLLGAAHNDEVPEGYTLSGPSPMCSGLSVFVSCEGMHMFQNDRLGPILYARTLVNFLRVRRFSVPFPHNQVRLGYKHLAALRCSLTSFLEASSSFLFISKHGMV